MKTTKIKPPRIFLKLFTSFSDRTEWPDIPKKAQAIRNTVMLLTTVMEYLTKYSAKYGADLTIIFWPDSCQTSPLILTVCQDRYKSQMAYLHTGPPKLKDDSKCWVVYHLCPLIRFSTAKTRHEDEWKAHQNTDCSHQMPWFLLTIPSTQPEVVWFITQPTNHCGTDTIG